MFRDLLLLFALSSLLASSSILRGVESHEESGEWKCESESEIRVESDFKPGLITLDGHAHDWDDIDGSHFSLLPALDPDSENQFNGGNLILKSVHDGHDIFFLLQVDSDYAYSKGESNKCPSVALMFQIGDNATYHNMGGCTEHSTSCTNKTCKGHEVDIMHFSIGNAIPGRLYGGNPLDNRDGNGGDRFGHLVDLYSWNPHCRYLDGTGPSGSANDSSAQNDWKGAWWHSSFTVHSGILTPFMCETNLIQGVEAALQCISASLTPVYKHIYHTVPCFVEDESPYAENGKKGTYFFEFSRPLRTMDHLQQDVQFTIGGSSKMSVAFWYPVDGKPWHGSGHYSVNCDWVPIDISLGGSLSGKSGNTGSSSSWSIASAFSLIISVAALCVSVFVSYRVFNPKSVAFTPMENL